MLATSLSKDLYKTFFHPEISDAELLKVSRKLTVLCGIAGIFIAYYMANIITALAIFYSLMTVSLAAPFLFGLFTEKASTKGAFCSAVLGVAVVLGLKFFNGGKGIGILNSTSLGIIVAKCGGCHGGAQGISPDWKRNRKEIRKTEGEGEHVSRKIHCRTRYDPLNKKQKRLALGPCPGRPAGDRYVLASTEQGSQTGETVLS